MKAYVLRSYGSPGRLALTDAGMPVPAADEVLVRVRATSVNPYDWHHMRGVPYVARPLPSTLGLHRPLVSQRIALADVVGCASKKEILTALATLINDGEVVPVIGRSYPFHEIPEAIAYQEQGHATGKVVITI